MRHWLYLLVAFALLAMPPLTAAAETPSLVSAPAETTGGVYVIAAGDWLSKIASSFLGDAMRYPEIVAATNTRAQAKGDVDPIANPDRIEIGQRVWVPGENAALWAQLQTATLVSEWVKDPVSLMGGKASVAVVPGSATKVGISVITAAYTDLNGDGRQDAAAVVATDPGGSGTFYTLEAFLSQDGALAHGSTQLLGDRIRLNSLTAREGRVTVGMLVAGPDDPLCCPSTPSTKTYALQDGAWAEVADTQQPLPTAKAAAVSPDWAYKGFVETSAGHLEDLSLYLDVDGKAHLKTDRLDGHPAVVADGAWQMEESTLVVTLTTEESKALPQPRVLKMALGEHSLTPESGLPKLTSFQTMAWDRLVPPYAADGVQARMAKGEYIGVYKAFLPSASCCGQDITLYLNQGGDAKMVTDYTNGETPISEVGTWQSDQEGVTVTFTGIAGQAAFTEPSIMRLLPKDGVLVSVETVPEAWGYRFYAIEGLARGK